jgi:glucose-1-phosphate cytidylyltransferase
MQNRQLIILAGGFGTRIAEESDYIPKPMVKVGYKPIIWHIIKYYAEFGFDDFIVLGGYKFQILNKFFNKKNLKKLFQSRKKLSVKVIYTGKSSNTGQRIKRVEKYLNDEFCLTYGDGLCDINLNSLIKFHKKTRKALITVTSVLPPPRFGKLKFNGIKISNFYEKKNTNENWINGGFFVCNKKVLSYFKKKNTIFESDVLTKLAKKNFLYGYKHKGFWYCLDTLRDKRYLNFLWKSKKAPWKIW